MKWAEMSKGLRQFLLLCILPLSLNVALTAVMFVAVGIQAAVLTQFVYLSIWMFVVGGYIVFIDSKRRWPNTPAFDRFANVITFKRD